MYDLLVLSCLAPRRYPLPRSIGPNFERPLSSIYHDQRSAPVLPVGLWYFHSSLAVQNANWGTSIRRTSEVPDETKSRLLQSYAMVALFYKWSVLIALQEGVFVLLFWLRTLPVLRTWIEFTVCPLSNDAFLTFRRHLFCCLFCSVRDDFPEWLRSTH